MSKEDMIKEAVEEAKAEAAKMEDEAAADEQDEAAETKGSVEEEASKETEESQDTKDTESKEKKKFFAKKDGAMQKTAMSPPDRLPLLYLCSFLHRRHNSSYRLPESSL